MTPKDKAKELTEKFFSLNTSVSEKEATNPFLSRKLAKECSLICVEESINASRITAFASKKNKAWFDVQSKYLQDVKTELQRL